MYDGRQAWPHDWHSHRVDDYLGDWMRAITRINAAWVALAFACPPLGVIRQLNADSRAPRVIDQHA